MEIRRVVTGRTPEGKSVFVSDGIVEPLRPQLMPGSAFGALWGSDAPVELPSDGTQPATVQYFPGVGGFRFAFLTLPPASTTPSTEIDFATAVPEFMAMLPGLAEHSEPDSPGMHTTNTIDFDIILEGELWLELDDGAEVHLKQGDCVIQNGTRHAWHNKSDRPTTMAVAIVGAVPPP